MSQVMTLANAKSPEVKQTVETLCSAGIPFVFRFGNRVITLHDVQVSNGNATHCEPGNVNRVSAHSTYKNMTGYSRQFIEFLGVVLPGTGKFKNIKNITKDANPKLYFT